MDYDELVSVHQQSAAWKLLRADNFALIIGFLSAVFVDENVREVRSSELEDRLDDYLYVLRDRFGKEMFPRSPAEYLNEWATKPGWLDKRYPVGKKDREEYFSATAATEQAVAFVRSLGPRLYVGTQSRLDTVFFMLDRLAVGAEEDPRVRLASLYAQRERLDDEIAAVEAGELKTFTAGEIADGYSQVEKVSLEILSDFRVVESRFRELDRDAREKIAMWEGPKGEFLSYLMSLRDGIAETEQGRSFNAFYDFLLSEQLQERLSQLMERVEELADGGGTAKRSLTDIRDDWARAADHTQGVVRQLSEQLRRFLETKAWTENRRVMELIRGIETRSKRLSVWEGAGTEWMSVDVPKITVNLPMQRPLMRPVSPLDVDSRNVESDDDAVDLSEILSQSYVDPVALVGNVNASLASTGQVTLAQLAEEYGLADGMAELITYVSLVEPTFDVMFDLAVEDEVVFPDPNVEDRFYRTHSPRVTFVRKVEEESW